MNFDGSAREAKGGIGYIIRDSDGRLLVAGSSFFFQSSVLDAKLRVAWMDIIYTVQELCREGFH